MGKPTILLVIDNLQKGGAEVLLVGILPELNQQFDVILVTLSEKCDFSKKQIICKRKYELGFKNKYSLLACVGKLKKIIEKEKPSFIHSHLFFSSLITRIACPAQIPVFYSLHNEMSKNVFNGNKFFRLLEKKTIKENHFAIAVSENVKHDYEKTIGENKNLFVLPNYISNDFFESGNHYGYSQRKTISIVAVGNIKKQKNYSYLVKAFQHLKHLPVTLDIYGAGNANEIEKLKAQINKNDLPVFIKGKADMSSEILSKYDLFVSSSLYEGFGIAVIEAMAKGLPVLLSDICVFHEVTLENALFFDINDPRSFVELINDILKNKYDLKKISENGIVMAKRYNKENFLKNLFNIYREKINKKDLDISITHA